MLTHNIRVDMGLVNGATGIIVGFIKAENNDDPNDFQYVLVNVFGFECTEPLFHDNPCIVPISRRMGPQGVLNFPLLQCNSVTIHKSQGSTYTADVYLDLGDWEWLGSTFVALSRIKTFEQLFLYPFDFQRYEKIGQGEYFEQRSLALSKLDDIKYTFGNITG